MGNFDGNVFGGRIEMNRGLGVIRVKGILDANKIHIETTEVLTGGKAQPVFDGFVMERRMVLEISGKAANGQPAKGLVSMVKQ